MCQMDKLETSTTFGAKYFEHKIPVPARKMCYLEWPDGNSSDYNAGVRSMERKTYRRHSATRK